MQDFAFFVVNFGYNRAEYDALTQAEKLLILKAYETKTVTETTLIRDAVFNATINANRKRGKPFRKLWRKITTGITKHEAKQKESIIKEIEKKETGWIDALYRASGRKKPENKKKKKKNDRREE